MSILIKGMDIPKSLGVTVTIFPDGRVIEYNGYGNYRVCGKAVSIQPNGELIEKGYVIRGLKVARLLVTDQTGLDLMEQHIRKAPTIIPAEEANNSKHIITAENQTAQHGRRSKA